MSDPVVSVIIPSYNREHLIIKAINSILNQTYKDFEILVIDDASTDNTKQVIEDLRKENIRYFRLEKNGGQCIARNYGVKMAKGQYIAFLDSDDEWLPNKLNLQIECFKNGSDRLGCVYAFAYQNDVIKGITTLASKNFHRGNIYNRFLEGFCPPTPSIFMVKKEAYQKVGGFDENLITFVDFDLWMRISQYYDFDFVEEPLIIKYEQIGDQYVNNFEKRYKGYRLLREKWRDDVIKINGKNGWLKLRKRIVRSLIIPFLDHPPQNIRKHIFKLLGLLISIRSTNFRLYIKAIIILIFGPRVIGFIRKRFHRNFY
jgi:glycosyltransferase involved in cell wall biosynthesis